MSRSVKNDKFKLSWKKNTLEFCTSILMLNGKVLFVQILFCCFLVGKFFDETAASFMDLKNI